MRTGQRFPYIFEIPVLKRNSNNSTRVRVYRDSCPFCPPVHSEIQTDFFRNIAITGFPDFLLRAPAWTGSEKPWKRMIFMKDPDEKYIARCYRKLREYNAPLSGWYCVKVIDVADDGMDTAECELCGCRKVRYIHVMRHEDYFDDFRVGCICAGIMEGDILKAKDRERIFRNRRKRKENFPAGSGKLFRTEITISAITTRACSSTGPETADSMSVRKQYQLPLQRKTH
jgi:hypothetical protein